MRNQVLALGLLAAVLHLAVSTYSAGAADPDGKVPPWGEGDHAGTSPTGKESAAEAHFDGERFFDLCDECRERPRFWLRGEYVLWWTKNGNIPLLLTRGESTDPLPGAVGQPNTKPLYGGDVAFHERSGARFTAGMALGAERLWSLEAGYFFLNARRVGVDDSSAGNPILARPFTDANTSAQNSSITTFPGILAGNIDIESSSYLYGLEANVQRALWQAPRLGFEMLAGFRYLDLIESLQIQENTSASLNAPNFAGRTIHVADRFGTDNHFYGGQLGMRSEFEIKRLRIGLLAKLAFGAVQETARINGQTLIDSAVPTNVPAGLLALSSNSGEFSRTAFAVVPELGINVGLRVTQRLTALAGYSFIYWNRVVRPGDQVDTTLNPNLIPTSDTFGAATGPRRPAFTFHETDYWAQGVTFGLEFRY